jgi:hypothetical protein
MFRAMRNLWLCLVLVACGPGPRDHNGTDAATTSDGTGGTDSGSNVDSSRVYAHSGSKLYRIDTKTLQPQEIGPMTGLGTQSLTDLAVDKADYMVGITLDKLFHVDATTGAVTLLKDLSQSANGFTSLSYVPQNLNDPASADILVSANDQGDVFQIDPSTGNATKIGSYGSTSQGIVRSSGDLIGVRDFGIYATVDVGTLPNDYLARIDPVTWKATPLPNSTGYNNIFGLAYWAGTVYGFVDMGSGAGKIIKIDPNTGSATELDAGAVRWYGAAVTTDAPIIQ